MTCLHAMPLYHNYPCFKYPPNLIAYSRVPNKHKDMFINPNWHRAWDAFISLSFLDKKFANSASNFKSFSRSLEQFFLTVGQNNFGNKIPFLTFFASEGEESTFIIFAKCSKDYVYSREYNNMCA